MASLLHYHGPNLNLLGNREPEVGGKTGLSNTFAREDFRQKSYLGDIATVVGSALALMVTNSPRRRLSAKV